MSSTQLPTTVLSFPPEVTNALNYLPVIQQSLANITARLDNFDQVALKVDELTTDLWGEDGIDQKLQYVAQQYNDNEGDTTDLRVENKRLRRELDLLKSVVIRLDRKDSDQEKEITNLKGRSMRDNILIHHFPEKPNENLHDDITNAIKTHLNVDVAFMRIHRNSSFPNPNGNPRSITGKLVDFNKKSEISQAQKAKKQAGVELPFYITPQTPPEITERRKQLFEINEKYNRENTKTRVVGNKLVFPNGSVYTPRAEDILMCDETESDILDSMPIETSNTYTESGNEFVANGARAKTYGDVRKFYRKVCSMPRHAQATHRIMVYRFLDQNGKGHEGLNDDGEHGAGRKLLQHLRDNNMNNVVFVVTRWFSGKHIGPKRFTIMQELVTEVSNKL